MSQPLAADRHQFILHALETTGSVVAQQLAITLGVSIDTIRRDLNELAAQQQLVKVHGGAVRRGTASLPRTAREQQFKSAKQVIGKLASSLIRPKATVLFDNSTTVLEIVHQVDPKVPFTGITHSLPAAMALAALPQVEVILIGGRLDRDELMSADAETIERLHRFRADLGFLGVCGIHSTVGLSTENYQDMLIKQAIVQQSQIVVAPMSPEKLDQALPYSVCPLHQLDYLVLDQALTEPVARPYLAAGIQLLTPAGVTG